MGRPPRIVEPGPAYQVLNRRVMRRPLFRKDDDYLALERGLAECPVSFRHGGDDSLPSGSYPRIFADITNRAIVSPTDGVRLMADG